MTQEYIEDFFFKIYILDTFYIDIISNKISNLIFINKSINFNILKN